MYALNGGKIAEDEQATADFLDQFEGKTERKKRTDSGKAKRAYARAASYDEIRKGFDRLASVQGAIDHRLAIENSLTLAFWEAILYSISSKKPEAKTLEQLYDDLEMGVTELGSTVEGALSYSGSELDRLLQYRNETTLPKFSGAIESTRSLEEMVANELEVFHEAEGMMKRTKMADPNFPRLYRAYQDTMMKISGLENEKAKASDAIKFRHDELKALEIYAGFVNLYFQKMDRTNAQVQDISEHVATVKRVLSHCRETGEGIKVLYAANKQLSGAVMRGAGEIGMQIAQISSIPDDSSLPDSAAKLMSGYRQASLAADSRSRARIEMNAEAIMGSYGLR